MVFRHRPKRQLMHHYLTLGNHDLPPTPRQLIQSRPILLDCAVHRRPLHQPAGKTRQSLFNRCLAGIAFSRFDYRALSVLAYRSRCRRQPPPRRPSPYPAYNRTAAPPYLPSAAHARRLGSSVPAWPSFTPPRSLLAYPTTCADDIPGGFNTFKKPHSGLPESVITRKRSPPRYEGQLLPPRAASSSGRSSVHPAASLCPPPPKHSAASSTR